MVGLDVLGMDVLGVLVRIVGISTGASTTLLQAGQRRSDRCFSGRTNASDFIDSRSAN